MKAYPPPQYALKLKWLDIILASREATLRVAPFRTGLVRRTTQPPQIDGKLDDPCWERAEVLDNFVTLGDGEAAGTGTGVRLVRDADTLYIAAVCDVPVGATVKAKAGQPEGDVVQDDSVQFFFDTDDDPATYLHVAVNALGAVYDARHAPGVGLADAKRWNASWRAAATRSPTQWTVEMAVDLKHLSAESPTLGSTWRFNAARSRPEADPERSCWSLCYETFCEPENFGTLRFD
jgi:hypothetical protein